MKINIIFGKGLGLLIGILCGGMIIPGALSAEEKVVNPRFVELRISSPVNYQNYSSHIPKLVSGSILKTYLIEYQYSDASYRVVGMDIRTADNEIYCIHLAPPNLFIKQGFALRQGDNVIVRGATMNIDRHPALIATVVSCRGQSIRLRTDQGIPTWDPDLRQLGRSQISKLEN